ncbi:sigma-70 family RNA polymerase sigma factor [Corynebacterium pacaense]|uniref:sigma-70 family RNA polymerase sigma factor n=1 Tax=Corynebacterium pacaense TaxID=1816684 RepID=UPI0009B94047|nr:sigma-70 family RNA polymerase sigma factor [Corynebacterium pacaense]
MGEHSAGSRDHRDHRNHSDHGDHSDQELVADYVAGNQGAFATIVNRHQRHMFRAARKYGNNDEDAHDILQEALLKASRNMHLYRAEAALGTWLHRLVLNSGFDWAKHRTRRELAVLDDTESTSSEDPRLAHDPLGYLDVAMTIREAMNQLHPDQRTAIILVDLGGYPIEEVAHFEGVRPGTIKSRRARAKAALREILDTDFFGEPAQ